MKHQRSVRVYIGNSDYEVPYGTAVTEVLDLHGQRDNDIALAAIVHQRCVDLIFPLTADATVEPVTYARREGVLVYRRTASLILFEAVRRVFGPIPVCVGQALGNGYIYEIQGANGFSADDTKRVEKEMRALIAEDIPLRTELVMLAEARRIFQMAGNLSKVRLLKTEWKSHVTLVFCGESCDIHHYPVAPSSAYIEKFEIVHEAEGLLLRFPIRQPPRDFAPFLDSPKLKATYTETARWLDLLEVRNIGQLNEHIISGQSGDLIRIAEGLHEKKISQIADQIVQHEGDGPSGKRVRIVLISGPSSSGKTTFSKRLSLQLRVNGIRPVSLSTDNFYVDRQDTPLDPEGNYDFESIEAIDLPLFNDVLNRLLSGEETATPRYDFQSGRRKEINKWQPMRLARDQLLLIEGIHGLNPRLTEGVDEAIKFRVYINALTQLSIDDHNRLFTSDTRLLRRIVRDRLFRGYSAAQTIATWPRVRKGELRWIYPYQEGADIMFNSALVYEHALLRRHAERFLIEVPEDDPAFVTAYRLLRFAEYFVPIVDQQIPETSLLREFIGGSYFRY